MKLRSSGRVKTVISCSLVAALSHTPPASAEEVRLIPPLNQPGQISAFEGSTQDAAPSQPLRVVIPNIKERKEAEKKAAAAKAQASSKSVGEALYASASDVWNNAVLMADKGQNFVIRTMFKPNLEFAQLPVQWQLAYTPVEKTQSVAFNAEALANLSPAAGGNNAPLAQPASPKPQQTPVVYTSTPLVQDTTTAAVVDTTEPAPALSSQSKTIASKIPQVADPKPKETAKKVDIARNRDTGDVLNKDAPPTQATGLKVGGAKAKFDVNYELERAYNALLAGKSSDAIQIYEDILTGDPRNKEALFGLASTYHRTGQIDNARVLYGKLLEIDPKHRDGLNNFLVLLADEAPQEALAQMERLEGQNPGFSPIPAQMAIIYQKLGDQDKAVDKMYRALAIAPENITYRYNLAIMLDKNGKYGEAEKLYSQILDAHARGEVIPGDATKIQQRLTFIRSNTRS